MFDKIIKKQKCHCELYKNILEKKYRLKIDFMKEIIILKIEVLREKADFLKVRNNLVNSISKIGYEIEGLQKVLEFLCNNDRN